MISASTIPEKQIKEQRESQVFFLCLIFTKAGLKLRLFSKIQAEPQKRFEFSASTAFKGVSPILKP